MSLLAIFVSVYVGELVYLGTSVYQNLTSRHLPQFLHPVFESLSLNLEHTTLESLASQS